MEAGKIFVGGLNWNTEKEGLMNHFAQFGEVTDCVVMKSNVGKSRGFGFVTFADPDTVTVVLAKDHTIDQRKVDAKPCCLRGATNGNKGPRSNFSGRTTKVFLGGLPNDASEDSLKIFFSKYGLVTEVVIMMDNERQRPRGFGFLTFDNEEAVDEAVKDHFLDFNGKKIEVKKAEPRQGGGMGRRQNNQEQGWGDGWNQNQGYGGGFQQSNQYGGFGNQGFDPNWSQQQYNGQSYNFNNQGYGQGGYNQGYQGYGNSGYSNYGGNQGYSGSQGYSGQGYGGAQGYSGNQGYSGAQGYSGSGGQGSGGNQGYSGAQGYGGSSQSSYGGQQSGYGGGSQDGYGGSSGGGGGGKASSNSGGSQGYHPYKR